jgi:hypothetical protein
LPAWAKAGIASKSTKQIAIKGARGEKCRRHLPRTRFMRLSLTRSSFKKRGVLAGLGSGEDRGARLRGAAVRAGLPDVFVRAHLERSLRDSVFPTIASVPRPEAARATEASSRCNRAFRLRE